MQYVFDYLNKYIDGYIDDCILLKKFHRNSLVNRDIVKSFGENKIFRLIKYLIGHKILPIDLLISYKKLDTNFSFQQHDYLEIFVPNSYVTLIEKKLSYEGIYYKTFFAPKDKEYGLFLLKKELKQLTKKTYKFLCFEYEKIINKCDSDIRKRYFKNSYKMKKYFDFEFDDYPNYSYMIIINDTRINLFSYISIILKSLELNTKL